jgi:hypothetical protein
MYLAVAVDVLHTQRNYFCTRDTSQHRDKNHTLSLAELREIIRYRFGDQPTNHEEATDN